MNSLRYLVSHGAEKEAGPAERTPPPARPALSLLVWIWQWVVCVAPFLARLAPTRPLAPRRRPRKPARGKASPSASLPAIARLFAPRPRKLLVLDLDETLVHTMSRGFHRNCQMVEVQRRNSVVASFYYVAKRPFCIDFLHAVMQWYDLAIFTASVSEYADPIIDLLEHDLGHRVFRRRLYRDSCIAYDGGYVKDLTVLNEDLGRVILIDNSPISFAMQLTNGLEIEGWISDPSDRALLQLLPLLFALRHSTDVRHVLALNNSKLLS